MRNIMNGGSEYLTENDGVGVARGGGRVRIEEEEEEEEGIGDVLRTTARTFQPPLFFPSVQLLLPIVSSPSSSVLSMTHNPHF